MFMVHKNVAKKEGISVRSVHRHPLHKFLASFDKDANLNNFYHIEAVPVKEAEKVVGMKFGAQPNDTQNMSPKVSDMIKTVKSYGGTLEGYVIPTESGRKDARVSFDGMTLDVSDDMAKVIKSEFAREGHSVDEFDKVAGGWRFWWD